MTVRRNRRDAAWAARVRSAAVLLLVGVLFLGMTAGSGCTEQRVVTCRSNEAYDARRGVCYPCPAGYKVDRGTATCVVNPHYKPDTKGGDVVPEIRPDVPDPDTGPDDVPDVEVMQPDLPPVEIVPDVPVIPPDGLVGSSCNMDMDCIGGLSCFDWPGGYCIRPDCKTDSDCPDQSVCLPLLQNSQACFKSCDAGKPCRSGYACKGIVDQFGVTRSICHPVSGQNRPLGAVCSDPGDCQGSLGCVPVGSARMCTRTGCSNFEPCPDGSQCVIRGTFTLCLPDCEDTGDCDPGFLGKISCQDTATLLGPRKKVCTSAATGLGLGQLCYAGEDCESSYCHLVVRGQCSDNSGLCGSDGDCQQGFCVLSVTNQKGVCSQGCGAGSPCPADFSCVMVSSDAVCMSVCTNQGGPCGPTGLGMTCRFGLLYYPHVSSGKYACVRIPSGESGTSCKGSNDCLGAGQCYVGPQAVGYCYHSCFSSQDCPFGSGCLMDRGECWRMCKGDGECPAGFRCLSHPGASDTVCDLPL